MNPCESTTGLFSEYYDGGLTPEERQALEEHLRSCPSCRLEYEAYTRSLRALHETEPLETTQVFMGSVRAAVQEELGRRPGGGGRVPAWVPWALSGVLAAGFGAGVLVSRRAPDRALARSLEHLKGELARRSEAPRESGPAPAAPVEEEAVLARHGMVSSGGTWIPRAYDQAFREGKVFLAPGRAVTRREAALELAGELPPPPPAPGPPAGGVREEEVFEKYGLVRHEGTVLPRAWLERWARGEVLVGVDRWRTVADFKADLLREHDLVERGGRIMSRREAEEIAARRLVRRPEGASASNPVTAVLEGLRIGAPVAGGGLTLYPLVAEGRPSAPVPFRSLQEALAEGKLELSERETFFSIQARNDLGAEVFLVAGQVLQGGRCDRVVAADTRVSAGRAAAVPVLCVEPGAWRAGGSKFARESGHYWAPPSIRRLLVAGAGQGAVWAALGRGGEKGGGGLVERFRRKAEELVEFRDLAAGLAEREPGTVGLVLAAGGGVLMAELFSAPALLGAYGDRMVRAAALELLERAGTPEGGGVPSFPDTVAGVKRFLEGFFACSFEAREGGLELQREGTVVGRASLAEGEFRHALLFAPGGAEGGGREAPAVPREKMARVLAEIEARMADRGAGPLRRAEAVREIASIRAPETVTVLLRHLRDPDLAVRRAVVRELGDGGDPAAVKDLLDLLKASRKEKDAALYAETARALARIGDERAVPEFLRQMDSGDAEAARVVLRVLPDLLLQLRGRDPLERAVGRLIDLFGAAEAAARGEPGADPGIRGVGRAEARALAEAAQAALRQVTGLDGDRAAAYLKWWNERANRERFLRERTGR